jgi:phosphoserine phosphatase
VTAVDLIVFDMEGTLTTDPTVWEIMHRKLGTWDSHGLPYWERFKAGAFPYDDFARLDVAAWAGAPQATLDAAVGEVPLTKGCRDLFAAVRARGIRTAIVTNGLERLATRLATEFAIDRVAANREIVSEDGALTGEVDILVPYEGKGEALRRIASELDVPPARVMAVGDGVADAAMFALAGVAVAVGPENAYVAGAAHHVFHEPDLLHIVPLLDMEQP